jgi:cytochrome c oxidase subunit 2
MKKRYLAGILLGILGASGVDAGGDGAEQFARDCAACHGAKGEGNDPLKGPSIAGLPEWYVAHELNRFQKHLRGADPKDEEGVKMHAVASVLSKEEVTGLSEYVASLERPKPSKVPSVFGNAQRGALLYAQHCAACHQADGTGSEAEKAPPLTGYQDWYLAVQLEKFKSGLRALAPQDVESAKMHAMVKEIESEAEIRDLISYVRTLGEGGSDQ